MKTIIAGGRDIVDHKLVRVAIESAPFWREIDEVVCGCAAGVDELGARWAENRLIPVKDFQPDWLTYGKAAGPIRNKQMAEYADALILVWNGKSKGSANMLKMAKRQGLKIYEHVVAE